MYTEDEKELLIQLRDGSCQALDYFYHQYSLRIYRKVLKMVRVEVIAEELMQDVFVKIWDRRQGIDPDQSFKSYLYTIAQNLVYDFYRKLAREEKLQGLIKSANSEMYVHVEEEIFLKETNEILNKAINNLPSQQKLVFTLCKLEGKSYEDAGAALGISSSTINGHIVKATRSVKGYIFREQNALFFFIFSLVLTSF
ncbi:MAG: RNA polymerase sigma factor [Daejeonella sp.]|uniref:RNA polymerase sigma factor n=1 Tax=Daejeonella sp. JGW-45 TaxID=3034148 RepID=UPI0023EB9A40|nr:sigma-70 family RNA polymerase sigma factor [Daejeonella sp. JGW-45]